MTDQAPRPRLKENLRVSQLDASSYELIHPITGAEFKLDSVGYIIAEQPETGDSSLEEVQARLRDEFGLNVSNESLTEFLKKADGLDMLEVPLRELGIVASPTGQGSEVFQPKSTLVAAEEVQKLRHELSDFASSVRNISPRTLIKILLAVLLFVFPWPFHVGGHVIVEPIQRVVVRSPVSGSVEKILAREGDRVELGQPLVKLSGYEDAIQRKQAEIAKVSAELDKLQAGPTAAEINQIEKKVELAQKIFFQADQKASRYQSLFDEGLVSDQELQDIRSEKEVQAKRLEEAIAELRLREGGTRKEIIQAQVAERETLLIDLRLLQELQKRSVITSPITGVIASSDLSTLIGKSLTIGDRVLEVVDLSVVSVELSVSERNIAFVDIGSRLTFKVQSLPNMKFTGTVSRVAPVAEIGSSKGIRDSGRYFRVYGDFKNSGFYLLPGMSGYGHVAADGIYFADWHMLGLVFFRHAIRIVRVGLVL